MTIFDSVGDSPWHTLQRSRECGLACVCLALNINYVKVSNIFRERYGETWEASKQKSSREAKAFLRELGVRGDWFDVSRPQARGFVPDLKGVGILTVTYTRSGGRHAVAYKNGMIHDSCALYPMPFPEWSRRTGRHVIDGWERLK